jgi:hypothetical protein
MKINIPPMPPEMLRPDGTLKSWQEREAMYRPQTMKFHEHKAAEHKRMVEQPLRPSAEQEARRLAEQAGHAAGAAKLNPPAAKDPNPYRRQLEEAKAHTFSFSPSADHRRLKNLEQWANEYDAKLAQEATAIALAMKLAADPSCVNCKNYIEHYEKVCPPDEQLALSRAKGQLSAGDAAGAWATIREAEQREWARQDAKLVEHRVAVEKVDFEFTAVKQAIKECEARLAEITKQSEGTNATQPNPPSALPPQA